MRLLLDQGLPLTAAALLRETGHDVRHVSEVGLAAAEDETILQRARGEGRCVVTLDGDFHALLALSQARTPSVIRIREEGLKAEAIALLIRQVVERCEVELTEGSAVSVQSGQARLRRLPL